MNWLKKLMAGRYGGDQLSMILIILSLLLTFIGQLTKIQILLLISYIPLGISIYRIFSKDISKRRMENYKFAMFVSPIYAWFKRTENRMKDRKTHRYFKCPNCKSKLRLPKGKGKIMITCPECKTKFSKTT